MIPTHEMRQKLAYMNHRSPDGSLRPRDHLMRTPTVVDLDNEAEVARIFNSGGAGMFAKPQDYCSTYYVPSPILPPETSAIRSPSPIPDLELY